MSSVRKLDNRQRVDFAHQFRDARAAALRDSEAFEEQLLVMERLGVYVLNSHKGLAAFQRDLQEIASESPLAFDAAHAYPALHLSFPTLYDEARIGRNDAMHQGAVARHLARHAQELALIMEDALMSSVKTVKDFMVRNPITAELWQPLSAIRRTMLLNAFSFLPFQIGKEWRFVSDGDLATFLRSQGADRKKRMLMTLGEALDKGLKPTKAQQCGLDEPIEKLAKTMGHAPVLVFVDNRIVGLVTAFDLL